MDDLVALPRSIQVHALIDRLLPLHSEETVFVVDLPELDLLYDRWCTLFPRVHPFYAVKCNPDVCMVDRLAKLGAHFDCASMFEIDLVLGLGIDPARILYANPCKRVRDLREAYAKGVRTVTFDSIFELEKIKRVTPEMALVLRIYANDPCARCTLSNKFGAPAALWADLFDRAAELDLHMKGVSFHVGSGAQSGSAYTSAIAAARECFDLARQRHGWVFTFLDLGGGFSSTTGGPGPESGMGSQVEALAAQIDEALERAAFGPEVTIIAEPGRYFAETTTTLLTPVIGMRPNPTEEGMDYWITDSIYGSFNNIVYDHGTPLPTAYPPRDAETPKENARLFGPTCDGMDIVVPEMQLPRLKEGDWLAFTHMGAYTTAGASHFNGIPFPQAKRFYVMA